MTIIAKRRDSRQTSEMPTATNGVAARAEAPEPDVDVLIDEVKRAFGPIERDLVGFGPLVTQAVYALLTGENLVVFSPPGTAKSLFARLLFQRIRGAKVFDTQMSKGTLAEELFGSVDIEQMKAGRVIHNTRDTLVDADLAFIDEFFDANDMVLRAMLGILHERLFKKGTQSEPARLHTGIVAANYVRATGITEAVVDRFLFRATVAPDYHPFTLLAIDQAFARHHGTPASGPLAADRDPDDDRLPMSHLVRLKEIVTGRVPGCEISAPPHILFMKNALINRYGDLLTRCREQATTDATRPYISPRTYAKSRLVLNAAALLRGRREVTCEDLSQLRLVVTTIGGDEDEVHCFDDALRWTLMKIRDTEREQIDRLAGAQQLAEQVLHRVRTGEAIPCTRFLQRLLRMFGLISQGDVTFAHVRRFVDDIKPRDEEVRRLKQGVLTQLQDFKRRVDDQGAQLIP